MLIRLNRCEFGIITSNVIQLVHLNVIYSQLNLFQSDLYNFMDNL